MNVKDLVQIDLDKKTHKVLFVSPHPDDVEIGCGGTMHRMYQEGVRVDVAVVTGPGDLTMVHSGEVVQYSQRQNEQLRAARVLGVSRVIFMELAPASKFDTVPMSTYVTAFDHLLHMYDAVYVPLPSHAGDHNVVWHALQAATRPSKVDHLNVYAYEQPTQGHGPQLASAINCRKYVTLSADNMGAKEEALSMYQSQMNGREDTLVGIKGVHKLAELRGLEVGKPYAEMFVPIRVVD